MFNYSSCEVKASSVNFAVSDVTSGFMNATEAGPLNSNFDDFNHSKYINDKLIYIKKQRISLH